VRDNESLIRNLERKVSSPEEGLQKKPSPMGDNKAPDSGLCCIFRRTGGRLLALNQGPERLGKRVIGTCEWLLKQQEYGAPGIGKTTISSFMAGELERKEQETSLTTAADHSCDHKQQPATLRARSTVIEQGAEIDGARRETRRSNQGFHLVEEK
jgi:hypothetical protein